jgi:hypothetical protein
LLGNSAGLLTARRRSRPWIVRALGLLILVQAVAYVALSFHLLLPFDWSATAGHRGAMISPEQVAALSLSIILIPAALLAVSAAIGFFSLFRTGWVLAMATQGATLLGCLMLYVGTKPPAIFPVMLFSIAMAFSLNSVDVRSAFFGGAASHER